MQKFDVKLNEYDLLNNDWAYWVSDMRRDERAARR